jgi:hypothetical protein
MFVFVFSLKKLDFREKYLRKGTKIFAKAVMKKLDFGGKKLIIQP